MSKKILIIDDEIDILEPLDLLLSAEGYETETTTKGEVVYKIVEKFKPDLILLDVLISGSDGRLICKKLKETAATKKIPIVMMSAHPNARTETKDSGADDFMAKPFDVDLLFEVVKKYIK